MMRTKPLLLVDTNGWVDYFLGRQYDVSDTVEFFTFVRTHDVSVVYPVHILKDVFFFVQKELKARARAEGRLDEAAVLSIRKLAWACVQTMRETAVAVAADESDVTMACTYREIIGDLEDDLVLAAAERVHPDILVTYDKQLLRSAPVAITLTPGDAMKALQANRWGLRTTQGQAKP